jgi:flagellar capping protein FliD
MTGLTFGQTLQKGNTLSLHYYTLTLNEGVTMDNYLDFFKTKYKPAFEKNFSGVKIYLINGIKGEHINYSGIIVAWKSKATMEKYYNQDGSATEITKTINTKMKPLQDELLKLAKMTDSKYTSWEIQ